MYMMVDMELGDEDVLDCNVEVPCERPKFPYGLRISLTEKELEKLNIDPSCAFVGGMCHLHAMARVTAVSQNETEDMEGNTRENCRIELQIEDLAIEDEGMESDDTELAERGGAAALYDRR